MQAASKATYLSKKSLAAYTQQRSKNMKKRASAQLPKEESKGQEEVKIETALEKKMSVVKEAAEDQDSDLSDEAYEMRNRSCQEVYSDELDGGLNVSSDEEDLGTRAAINKQKMAFKQAPARAFRQEIDTNIFKIEFNTLQQKAELATGDPTICEKCKAVLNNYSKVDLSAEQQIWKCEFCNHENKVDLEEEEKPQTKATNYIVEAAAQVLDKQAMGQKEISVIFCVDQSGSMCVSQEVRGKHQLKGDKTGALQDLMKFSDGSDQFLTGERNVTYVSRMQCLQAAIDQQITDMKNGATDRKLGIVSFNNEVTVVGDGSKDPQTITGDKLMSYDWLIENGHQQGKERMQLKVAESAQVLQKKVMALEETGPTALGPAVATSIGMAAEGAPGSTVVICTDGLANIGVGSFDEAKKEEDFAKIEQFYEQVGEYAKGKGITINIVSITGDECNLDSLSKLAELTGGEVTRVAPIDLTKNFANILSKPIIASNVVCKVKLHKGLQFRHEDPASLSEDQTLMVRDIGNVTDETEITFEYTLRKIRELAKMEDVDLTKMTEFPFQAQITYKALDGSKCIRVITETQKISNDREELEEMADYKVIGTNAMQQQSKFARHGEHRFAQAYSKNMNRFMRQAKTTEQRAVKQQYVQQSEQLYNLMDRQDVQCQLEDAGMNYEVAQKEAASFSSQMQAPMMMGQKKMRKKTKAPMKKSAMFQEDYDSGSCSDAEMDVSEQMMSMDKDEKAEVPAKKSSGFFGAIAGMFGSSKPQAPGASAQPQGMSMPPQSMSMAMPPPAQKRAAGKAKMSAFSSMSKQSRKNDDYAEALSKGMNKKKF